MENYVMFKGVKIPITDEQMKELAHGDTISLSIKKHNVFKRIVDNSYYAISSYGEVLSTFDDSNKRDDLHYAVGNYCRDEQLLQQRALHETLNRLLWRFSMENGEDKNPWDGNHWHYGIYSAYPTDDSKTVFCDLDKLFYRKLEFCTYSAKHVKSPGTIYFPYTEIAKQAISEIIIPFMKEHPDFVW